MNIRNLPLARACALLVLLAVASLSMAAETRLRVLIEGQEFGKGRYAVAQAEGNWKVDMDLELDLDGMKFGLKSSSLIDAKGRSIEDRTTETGPEGESTEVVKYGDTVITIESTTAGKTETRTIDIGGKNLTSPAALWFMATTPKVGEKHTAWTLNQEKTKLIEETWLYVGLEKVRVPAGEFESHKVEISTEEGKFTMWLDGKGDLVRGEFDIEGIKLVLERV